MKKVVVISGSPRKNGNTMRSVGIIEECIKNMDSSVEFEYIHLIDKDFGFCKGCTLCLRHGGVACPLNDDGGEILAAMHSADGIIFTSPGYSHMVSGLFKNFIDRFMYLDHIPEFIGKPAMVVSTSGGDGVMSAPKYISNMSITWWGCTVTDVIGISYAFFMINRNYKKKIQKKLQKAATKFHKEIIEKPIRKPTFMQYMCFMLNKTELEISSTAMPYRTKVWDDNGWMQMDYYYTVPVNPVFKIVGGLLCGVMKVVFRILLGKNGDTAMAKYLMNN